jgi:protein TonB
MIDEKPLPIVSAPAGPRPKVKPRTKAAPKPVAMTAPLPAAQPKEKEMPPEMPAPVVRDEIVFRDAPAAPPSADGVALQAGKGQGSGPADGLVHAGPSGTGKGPGSDTGTGKTGDGGGAGGLGQAMFGGLGGPRFLRRELPEYPLLARRRKKEGTVSLMVTIDAHGKLIKVDVIAASDPIFVGPSVEAVKKSTFVPANRNGVPVAVKAILPIRFALSDS